MVGGMSDGRLLRGRSVIDFSGVLEDNEIFLLSQRNRVDGKFIWKFIG